MTSLARPRRPRAPTPLRPFPRAALVVIGGSFMVALAFVSLDCGGKVIFEETGGASSSQTDASGNGSGNGNANACARACKKAHPQGFETFDTTQDGCVCHDCNDACAKRVCDNGKLPSDACLSCVQSSIQGDDCRIHGGLFGVCLDPNDKDCGAYTACLLDCSP